MKIEVVMPQMGESVAEGTVTTWFKKVGDFVEKEEDLLEISTDKVDSVVPAPATGFLKEILFEDGSTVEVNTVIAFMVSDEAELASSGSASASVNEATEVTSEAKPAVVSSEKGEVLSKEERRRQFSSPLVRKIAADKGVDIRQIEGTGVSQRVTKKDLLNYLESGAKSTISAQVPVATPATAVALASVDHSKYLYQPSAGEEGVPFSGMRRHIAEHMVASREISVHVATVFEVDMTKVVRSRAKHKQSYLDKGVKLTYMPYILRAVTEAIEKFPEFNSSIVDNKVYHHRDVNIGIAVAVDQGLLVPVIKQADRLSMIGLSEKVNDLATRARSKKLSADEVKEGTFTVTNPGVFGSLFGTPIINQPQVAILCVGAINKRPVVTEEDAIAIRHMMYVSLSFDHRVIDGAMGDQFMAHVKQRLENFSDDLL